VTVTTGLVVATSTEMVKAMQYAPLEGKLALPELQLILYQHYKHFWARWWLGTPTNICLEGMWIITCEIVFRAAGYYSDYSDQP
jgi:hypothetical protein